MGLGEGAAGHGVRRVMLCVAWRSWGATGQGSVGAVGIHASALAEWHRHFHVWAWAWGDFPPAPSFPPCHLECLPHTSEDIRWSWCAVSSRGWTSLGCSSSACMASHASCSIHSPAGWSRRFSIVSLQGRRTGPLKEGSAQAHFRSSQKQRG